MVLLWKNYHNHEASLGAHRATQCHRPGIFFTTKATKSTKKKSQILCSFFVSFVPFVVEFGCARWVAADAALRQ